ncbi:MAG: hypothetical protein GY778_09075 [bacterium]|nr:hypothetical protein [bacterium]
MNTAGTAEFETLLRQARRTVYLALLRQSLLAGGARALWALAALAVLYLVLRATCAVGDWPDPLGWRSFGWLVLATLIVSLCSTVVTALGRRPSWREAAERLDLAVDDHNRIATSLCLAHRCQATAFGRAALADGLAHLRRLAGERPCLDHVAIRWRRSGLLLGLSVLATVGAVLCGRISERRLAAAPTDLPMAQASAQRLPPGNSVPRQREAKPPKPRAQDRPLPAGGTTASVDAVAGRPQGASVDMAAGRTGGGAGGQASRADRSASARGESAEALAASQAKAKRNAHTSPPGRSRDSKTTGRKGKGKQAQSSAVSRGASGGGSMSPVHHDWAQSDRTVQGNADQDDETDEEVEDRPEASVQRGGIQPLLKDRNESPSRELGLSGAPGPPGTGRGGPTPPKKSRGTASLVLGVPIPDFVKGRLGPGTTRIVRERIEPSPMPGRSSPLVTVPDRNVDEWLHESFDVPPALAALVRDYLVALHSADGKTAASGESPPPSTNGSPKE